MQLEKTALDLRAITHDNISARETVRFKAAIEAIKPPLSSNKHRPCFHNKEKKGNHSAACLRELLLAKGHRRLARRPQWMELISTIKK